MSKKSVYFWIKLKTNYYDMDEIDYMMTLEKGTAYVTLFQILCLKTANTNGRLVYKIGEKEIPYDIGKLKRETKYFKQETIEEAINVFKTLGLMKEDLGTLRIVDYEEMIGSETNWAIQKRNQKSKKRK